MALVGDWIEYESYQSETEIEVVEITYPTDIPEESPDFNKAGTTEKIEFPKTIVKEIVHPNSYVIIHSVNSWKSIEEEGTKNRFNACYRVYESKKDRDTDYDSFIYEHHLLSMDMDFSSNKNETQQAYDLLLNIQGFENLKKD